MQWRGISVFSLAAMALAFLMLLPAGAALYEGDMPVAAAFGQWAALIALAAAGLAFGRYRMAPRAVARGEILTVIACFVALPLAAAAPVAQALPGLTLERAYFEMVSTLTTTGLTTIDDLGTLSTALHLWRAATAWFGGFIALTAAAAVFGPRNLGGYEVQIEQRAGTVGRLAGLPEWAMTRERLSAERRLAQALRAIGPSYALLTLVLALAFLSAGVAPLTAVVQAAGVMATCGLTMGEGGFRGGMTVELLALIFMIFAATRHSFGRGGLLIRARRFRGDPELDLAAFTIAVAAGWVLLRGLSEPAIGLIGARFLTGLEAVWAAVFTTASFLSTTGYVSDFWQVSHDRVGLDPPGMLLMALAAMGGGVASTAGGVKLLRSFALFQHGMAEMHQLGHPSAVSARGEGPRRVGFAGAMLAWLFLMLFLLAIGVTALALSLGGAGLDTSLAAAIAANTNTGAVYAATSGADAPSLAGFSATDRMVLCAAMILGRVEVLAVVALANPAYWR